jgi:hypothetical protein
MNPFKEALFKQPFALWRNRIQGIVQSNGTTYIYCRICRKEERVVNINVFTSSFLWRLPEGWTAGEDGAACPECSLTLRSLYESL